MIARDIIVIGGSTGAVSALRVLLAELPSDFSSTIFVTVHIGARPEGMEGKPMHFAHLRTRRTWMAVALLIASTATDSSPRTIELFNEAQMLTTHRANGGKLYRSYCAQCHGRRAYGDPSSSTPSLAGQRETYVLKQLIDFAELDRDAPEMHRLMARPELGRAQAWRDLAAYLTSLRPNKRAQVGDSSALERGESLYVSACAFCHGEHGEGTEEGISPALRGQHYSYLMLQLRSFDADRRLNIEGMVIAHMTGLPSDDMKAIADYAARLPVSQPLSR